VDFRKAVRTLHFNLLKERRFENPLLKYIACFNFRDNEKRENILTAFCYAWLPGLRETSPS
jgi:hypothetical protein